MREAHYYIKFPEFYGIRIQTEELANCKHPRPSSPNPHSPQSPLMIYCTFVLPLTHSPSNWSTFISVSSQKLCMHFLQTPVRISPFAYLVVLDVVILISCRQHKLCAIFHGLLSRPWNVAHFRAHIVKVCRALSEDLCRKVVTNARVRLQEVVRLNDGHVEHVIH